MNQPSIAGHDVVFSRSRAPDDAWLDRAAPELPIEPDLPIVDPHVHFWHRGAHRYFVEEYARDVAASGQPIEATVFVECQSMYRQGGPEHLRAVGETEFAAGMAAIGESGRYGPTRVAAGIVAYVDLRLGARSREALDAHAAAAQGRLRGVRQRARWDPDPLVRGAVHADTPALYSQPEFRAGLALLQAHGLVFEASIFHPQIPALAELAVAHPAVSFVLIHTGSPVGWGAYAGREAETHAVWLAGMRQLARCDNVSLKLGGLLMSLGSFDFTREPTPPRSERLAALWRPWIEPALELFGARRCMASSNFPVDKAGFGYGTLWNMYKRLTAGCSRDEREQIFAGTASRVYRLPGMAR